MNLSIQLLAITFAVSSLASVQSLYGMFEGKKSPTDTFAFGCLISNYSGPIEEIIADNKDLIEKLSEKIDCSHPLPLVQSIQNLLDKLNLLKKADTHSRAVLTAAADLALKKSNKSILMLDTNGNTALHYASHYNHPVCVQIILDITQPKRLLLSTSDDDSLSYEKLIETIDCLSPQSFYESIQNLTTVHSQELITTVAIDALARSKKTVFAIDDMGRTALDYARDTNDLACMQIIFDIEKGYKKLKKLLLATNQDGFTAFHCACDKSNERCATNILTTAKNINDGYKILGKLLLAKDADKRTALHLSCYTGDYYCTQAILVVCLKLEETDDGKTIMNTFLMQEDSEGLNALARARKEKNPICTEILRKWIKEELTEAPNQPVAGQAIDLPTEMQFSNMEMLSSVY